MELTAVVVPVRAGMVGVLVTTTATKDRDRFTNGFLTESFVRLVMTAQRVALFKQGAVPTQTTTKQQTPNHDPKATRPDPARNTQNARARG